MAETLTPHLRLVPEVNQEGLEPTPQSAHPAVEDSPVNISSQQLADGTHLHTARFSGLLDGNQVIDVMSRPLAGIVDNFDQHDVRQGLRSQTYPNSRVVRDARYLGKGVRDRLRARRDDLQGLLAVIDHSDGSETVTANVHLYEDWIAELVIRDKLTNMSASQLSRLCHTHDIGVDEVKLWRLKGGRRGGSPLNPSRAGINTEALTQEVLATDFSRKILVDGPGVESRLVPRVELPPGITDNELFVERLKYLIRPDKVAIDNPEDEINQEIGERWRVLFRRDNLPRHVAMPVIQWRTGFRSEGVHMEYVGEMQYGQAASYYDHRRHLVVHASPLLGAALVANTVDSRVFRKSLMDLCDVWTQRLWFMKQLPPKAAGFLPALLSSAGVEQQLIAGEYLQALETRS